MPSQLRTAGLLPDLSAESATGALVTSLTTTPLQDHAEREDADMADTHTTSSVDVAMEEATDTDNPADSLDTARTARPVANMAEPAADTHADTRRSATSQSQRSELVTPDGSTATTDSSDPSEETTSPRVSNGDMLSSLRLHAREAPLTERDTDAVDTLMDSATATPTDHAVPASTPAKSQRRLLLRRPSQESSPCGRTQSGHQTSDAPPASVATPQESR